MKPIKLNREKELEVVLTICMVLLGIFLFKEGKHLPSTKLLLTVSLFLGLIGLFLKSVTARLAFWWMKLAELMGGVMNKVVLSALFFLLLVPMAMLARIFRKSKSPIQLSRQSSSYYAERNHRYTAKDIQHPW
ncbi:MAG: hypothetical protein JNK66_04860 [Chitinophagales bacterium]|nr:hypothetical protein [Chitinophagales bacterium]